MNTTNVPYATASLQSYWRSPLFHVSGALGMYGFGCIVEYILGYAPCKLCLYQQKFLIALCVVSGIFYLLLRRFRIITTQYNEHQNLYDRARKYALLTIGVLWFAFALLAGYHRLVQAKILPVPLTCISSNAELKGLKATDAADVDKALQLVMRQRPTRCDQRGLELLGQPLSLYGFLTGLFMALVAFKSRKKHY